ncbi:hypothetical protein MP228_004477 [Amoeboaphelidium protococcarum]|nr:hypothetical protein MP228_004477 [Amoeboaphelidium protococcarum]
MSSSNIRNQVSQLQVGTYAHNSQKFWDDVLMSPSPLQSGSKEGGFESELPQEGYGAGQSLPFKVKLKLLLSPITKRAVQSAVRSFAHAYGARVAINVAIALLSRLFSRRGGQSATKTSILNLLWSIVWKQESFRFGAFMGGFTLVWKTAFPILQIIDYSNSRFMSRLLLIQQQSQDHVTAQRRINRLNGFIAGFLSGFTILIESKSKMKMFGQQAVVRSMQCLYNAGKSRGLINLPYGDVVLFTLGTAQVLYAYVMHPQTLPKDFYGFMVQSAQIPHFILRQVEQNLKGGRIDVQKLRDFVLFRYGGNKAAVDFVQNQLKADINHLPCAVIHTRNQLCLPYNLSLWVNVFKQIVAVYIPLNLVPIFLLKHKSLVKAPVDIISKGILSAVRSSAFFACLVSLYQGSVCVHDKIFQSWNILSYLYPKRDHRYFYYLFGVLSGMTILLESKSRRSELAMYVAPKAVESLYRVLYKRRLMFKVRGFQTVMSSVAFGILMAFYATEKETLSPLVFRILKHFIGEGPR